MKILFLLVGNITYDGRVSKEIQSLREFGYDVVLVQTEEVEEKYKDKYDYPIHVISKKPRTSFLSGIKNVFSFASKLKDVIKQENPDFIHCNDINTFIYAPLFINQYRVVFDSHELAEEVEKGYTLVVTKWLHKHLLKKVHAVIMPQVDRINYFTFKYPEVKDKIYLLENFPIEDDSNAEDYFLEKFNLNKGDNKIVLYSGSMNKERCVDEIILAFKYIEGALLVLIGKWDEKRKKEVESMLSENGLEHKVLMYDRIPFNELLLAANSSDIGVCFYNDPNLNSYFNASNKIYEYLNNGVMVLTNETASTARVVDEYHGARISKITDVEIATALNRLLKKQKPQKTSYWWDNQDSILKKIYSL